MITAIGSGVVRAGARERVGDAVGQQLAVRQAGGRVVEGAALGDVDEARVVERDRGELGEAGQRRRPRAGPNGRSVAPDARPMTPTTSSARGERHADDRAEQSRAGRPRRAAPTRRSRRPRRAGPSGRPGRRCPGRLAIRCPRTSANSPVAVAEDELEAVRLERGRRSRAACRAARRRPVRIVSSSIAPVAAVEQGERRLVEGAQVRVAPRARPVGDRRARLGEVHRAVGDGHEGVLRAAVVRVAGDADADRRRVASRRTSSAATAAADPLGHLVGRHPVGARQDRGELVAAVAIEAVAVADRAVLIARAMLDQQRVAGRVTAACR